MRQAITVSVGDKQYNRCAYANFFLKNFGNEEFQWNVQVNENKDIVWCAMCFGRNQQAEPHLEKCFVLGYQLRKFVEPVLREKGFSFANVLFITEDALEEHSFKAVGHFWSLKVCALPRVHASRLQGVSKHLIDENIRPEHVFLKAEAWKINAGVSVISDLDTQIINGRYVADFLTSFARNGKRRHMLEECGGALMCRTKSKMRFGESYDPQVVRPLETNKKRGRMV